MYKYWFLETAIKGLLLINLIAFKRGINQYSIKLFPLANLAIKIKYLPATFYFESFCLKIQRFLFFFCLIYIYVHIKFIVLMKLVLPSQNRLNHRCHYNLDQNYPSQRRKTSHSQYQWFSKTLQQLQWKMFLL